MWQEETRLLGHESLVEFDALRGQTAVQVLIDQRLRGLARVRHLTTQQLEKDRDQRFLTAAEIVSIRKRALVGRQNAKQSMK